MSNTIVAISSGKGVIGIIRLSGTSCFSIVEKCCKPGMPFKDLEPKQVKLLTFIDPVTNIPIDQITLILYKQPQSFSGENMIEIFCHGGEIVLERIVSTLVELGATPAAPGEFTRRAFLNGKMDLVQAESIHQIIISKSEKELEASVQAYFGGYRKELLVWKNKIKELLRNIEAFIEFPEEDDMAVKTVSEEIRQIQQIKREIEIELIKRSKAQVIEKGINIPIVGIANAGKSSLFNLLLGCDRSIVHWEEGTTRDSVSEEIVLGKEKIRLIDTAGLRDTDNVVEKIGIKKTFALIETAPVVIWVTGSDTSIKEHEKIVIESNAKQRVICVISKSDISEGSKKTTICSDNNIPYIKCCLLKKDEQEKLVHFISQHIEMRMQGIEMPGIIRNLRQENIAKQIIKTLSLIENENREEIIAHLLKEVLRELGEIVGETTREDVLNSIFSTFCIGK